MFSRAVCCRLLFVHKLLTAYVKLCCVLTVTRMLAVVRVGQMPLKRAYIQV